jgi:hypothetical protein
LERKKRESKDSNYSAAELDVIRDIIYQMYKDKDVPTVQSLLVKLKEKRLPFDISIAIDDLAAKYGHTVLLFPPYYCVLNPIEMVWSQLKHKIRKVNITPNLHR